MSGDSGLAMIDDYQKSPDPNLLAELAASKDVPAREEDMEVRQFCPRSPCQRVNTRFADCSAGQGA